MGRFTVISQDAFSELQLDTGVILKSFNPSTPSAAIDEDIVCATTGGIQVTCTPTYKDMGEDIDNCPNNMLEFKRTDRWECKLSFTSLSVTAETIRLSLGAADATDGTITPRQIDHTKDFADVWWVGDLSNGGLAACCLKNALGMGLSLKTTKNEKGQLQIELLGHYSRTAQDTVPMVFYVSTTN